jgi:hypothetical protein
VASVKRCRVSDSKRAMCHSGHPSIGGHRVAWCERLGYVSHAPLGLSFNGERKCISITRSQSADVEAMALRLVSAAVRRR